MVPVPDLVITISYGPPTRRPRAVYRPLSSVVTRLTVQNVPGVPSEVLNPRDSWADKVAYDRQAAHLVSLFEKNFETFAGTVSDEVKAAALKSAA